MHIARNLYDGLQAERGSENTPDTDNDIEVADTTSSVDIGHHATVLPDVYRDTSQNAMQSPSESGEGAGQAETGADARSGKWKQPAAVATGVVLAAAGCFGIWHAATTPPLPQVGEVEEQVGASPSRNEKDFLSAKIVSAHFYDGGYLNVLIDLSNNGDSPWTGELSCEVLPRTGEKGEKVIQNVSCYAGKTQRLSFNSIPLSIREADVSGFRISVPGGDVIFEDEDDDAAKAAVRDFQKRQPASEEVIREINDAIEWARGLPDADYTAASLADYRNKADAAEKLLDKGGVSQQDAEKTLSDMKASEGALEKVVPVVVSGSGDDIVDVPDGYDGGLIRIHHAGSRNFSVWTCDGSMERIDLLVNTIGNYDGTVTDMLGHRTARHLEIGADGQWEISFFKISALRMLANGDVMRGDDVVGVPHTSEKSKLAIANSGEDNFVVRGISEDGDVELLVNEIGAYSGTVPNRRYIALVVESDGFWSVSW